MHIIFLPWFRFQSNTFCRIEKRLTPRQPADQFIFNYRKHIYLHSYKQYLTQFFLSYELKPGLKQTYSVSMAFVSVFYFMYALNYVGEIFL
jgi:hypothetical protein